MDGNVNKPTWRERTSLNMVFPLHDLPKHPERVLPKFDPRKGVSTEDHLKNFNMDLNLLNVQYEYVVFILFPYNFEPKASSWYFILQVDSLVDWDGFEKAFLGKFGN